MLPVAESTQRLFIALTPPESVRGAVAALAQPFHGVRWTPVDQIHVTLRFLGDIESSRQPLLLDRLSEIRVDSFPLPVEGAGVFPAKGPPRVLWVGVGSGHPRLHQLRQKIDDALLSVDIAAEVRAFHPHLTVGRATEHAASAVNAWARSHRDFAGPVFSVDAFELYQSELRRSGPEHTLIARFPLG